MSSRGRYSPLNTEMYTLYIESRLAGPLFGNAIIEISPRDRVRNIINSYLQALQSNEKISDLAIYNNNNYKLDWNSTLESQGIDDGTRLFIGLDRANILKPIHIAVIGISTLFIACILFIVTTILFAATGGSVPFDYGVVIDAGSTHTEVYLYHWSGDKERGTGNVYQKDSCEYEVGIASLADPVNIISCVKNVSISVPKGSLPVLYLGATAGMRILNLTSPKEANLILTTLKYALSTVAVQVKSIHIIPGENEALFSWISTNFLTHSFNKPEKNDLYGAMDLGGASTQFAYAVYDKHNNDSDITPLKLYGYEYMVKSVSFLCFGYIEAMYRNEALMLMLNSSATLYDPCLPIGYIETIDVLSFSKKPCINNVNFNTWLQNHTISGYLTIKGSSSYEQCRKSILSLIDQKDCKQFGFEQCLPDINLSSLNLKFMAFSGFYYVVHYLNGANSLSDFSNSTVKWCNLTWDEIKKTQPKSELNHILRYCFAATYIIELLTVKYGFDAQTWNSINFTKEIENADIGWTLGYMINSTNAIPEEIPFPPVISSTIFAPLAVISFAMIVISIVIVKRYGDMTFNRSHKRLFDV